jgi:hypothetical protein
MGSTAGAAIVVNQGKTISPSRFLLYHFNDSVVWQLTGKKL